MSNPLSSLNGGGVPKSALAGVQRMAVGGGARIPSFGAARAAAATPAPGSRGAKADGGVRNILSKPSRARHSGYSKTFTASPNVSAGGATPDLAGGL